MSNVPGGHGDHVLVAALLRLVERCLLPPDPIGQHRAANVQLITGDPGGLDGPGEALLVAGQDRREEVAVPDLERSQGEAVGRFVVVDLKAE